MNKNQQTTKHLNANKKPQTNKTNPEKVKQEIKKDISEGQGAITAREAGGMRD